jgi:general secretion pathway protein I
MTGRRGFTLLEVLVATVIMGIAVAGLIAGLSQSVKNAARLTDYDRAVMLARTKMSELLIDTTLPYEGALDGQFERDIAGGIPSGWRAAIRPFDVPPNAGPGAIVLQRVALELWWQPASGSRRTIEIESYRRARIPIPSP